MRSLAAVLLGLVVSSASGQERVLDFHARILVDARGTLTVTESISVQAEGREIRRGILRDFPTEYRDRLGNKVSVPLQVLGVTRNGAAENYALERLANGTRIRIGNAHVHLQRGRHDYEIRYRTAHQVGFFDKHDELYWNVNGNGWTLAFDRVSAEVALPQKVPAGSLRVEAYTGREGARGTDYRAEAREGGAAFGSTRRFAPYEGMTIVLAFPKGIVAEPTRMDRARRLLEDNPGMGRGLAGLAVLLGVLLACWFLFGRDPRPGPAYPRYQAPKGLGPAGVRYLDHHGYDDRCFAAALLGLGSRGAMKIRDQGGGTFRVEPTGKPAPEPGVGEKGLLQALAKPFTFHPVHDAVAQKIRDDFSRELQAYFAPRRYYSRNAWVILVCVAIGALTMWQMAKVHASVPVLVATAAAMLVCVALFAWFLLPAYSIAGRKLQDEIDGLRQYLSVAEKDDLARMKAPPQTAAEFSRLLPFAFALNVEKTWAERFAATLGAATVAAAVSDFYSGLDSGSWGSAGGLERMAHSFSSMDSTIAAAATPPGSSSGGSDSGGGGGGGSSGGGGGGGGGSGW